MGERRWRAAQQAGLTVIPAIVRETESHDLLRDALLENLHRAQLNPLEEAAAYQQMLEDFGCTQEELASRIKRSRPQISNTIRLLQAAADRPAPGRRRRAVGRARSGPSRAAGRRSARSGWRSGWSPKGCRCGPPRRSSPSARPTSPSATSRSPRSAREPNPRASEIAGQLADRLDTRVRVDSGKAKGRLTIEFASAEDLERIAAAPVAIAMQRFIDKLIDRLTVGLEIMTASTLLADLQSALTTATSRSSA